MEPALAPQGDLPSYVKNITQYKFKKFLAVTCQNTVANHIVRQHDDARSMRMNEPYCTEMTDDERTSGFSLIEIPNPMSGYFLEPKITIGVVKMLSDTQRLIKMVSPIDKSISYAHQGYIEKSTGIDKWKPIATAAHTLSEAITRNPISDFDINKKWGWCNTI